jgi:hypothetical protein
MGNTARPHFMLKLVSALEIVLKRFNVIDKSLNIGEELNRIYDGVKDYADQP